ncbi:MAG: WecB/TagA/CpsF family glycosyltransferase [Fimbriimonadaceae bacterium]|nr:WecB/TagA/CpsF family glycosyltransferase [Fimbriimonadaceae bacterium]
MDSETQRVTVWGVPIDCLTMEQMLDRAEALIASGGCHFAATPDTHGLLLSESDEELRRFYIGSALNTPDSYGVVWALSRRGRKQPRVTGVEFAEQLMSRAADRGWRVAVIGGAPGVAQEAAEKLRARHPGLEFCHLRDGYFTAEQEDEVVVAAAATRPDILFAAMGIPRQEKFIDRRGREIGAKLSLGVGGSFDVFSGRVQRAPAPIIALRLEWLWRILSRPRQAYKAASLPRFMLKELRRKGD